MISEFDDYAIHQSPAPINSSTELHNNAYDRYWFTGLSKHGDYYFGVAFGVYPSRNVQDGHFTFATEGKQHTIHASRRAPDDRSDNSVGPMNVEIVRPMRVIRITISKNKTGLECDLTFTACSPPVEEPRSTMKVAGRVVMDTVRFCQYGTWKGWIKVNRARYEVGEESLGIRDRSWGIRPLGEREGGALVKIFDKFPFIDQIRLKAGKRLNSALFKSQRKGQSLFHRTKNILSLSGFAIGAEPGVYWIWNHNLFDDFFSYFGTFETAKGQTYLISGAKVPRINDIEAIPLGKKTGIEEMMNYKHSIEWKKGTRYPKSIKVEMQSRSGEKHIAVLEPILTIHMLSLGYEHPEWRHGTWKGEEVVEGESWVTDEVPPLERKHIHIQQLCKVKMGDHEGVGIVESLVFGPHKPSGFSGLYEGAK